MTNDHRLTYVCKGTGRIQVEDIAYACERGDLFYWGPGVRFRVHRKRAAPLTLINIHFDLVCNHGDNRFAPPFDDGNGFNPPLFIRRYVRGEEMLMRMLREYKHQELCNSQQLNLACVDLLESISSHLAGRRRGCTGIIGEIVRYIHEHCSQPLTNAAIARAFHLHPNHINRLMTSRTGISLHQHVLHARLQKAADMLQSCPMSVTEIAHCLGFCDVSHFSRMFKSRMGYSPNEARREALCP